MLRGTFAKGYFNEPRRNVVDRLVDRLAIAWPIAWPLDRAIVLSCADT